MSRGNVMRAGYVCAVTFVAERYALLPFDPISFVLPKETASSRQRKALWCSLYDSGAHAALAVSFRGQRKPKCTVRPRRR